MLWGFKEKFIMADKNYKRKKYLAEVFSRSASTYDCVGPQFFSHFGHRLVELTEIPKGAKVLDVASGNGATLFPSAERVGAKGQIIGIDLSEGMVHETATKIQRSGIKNVEICQIDAEHLSFLDASFDLILCGFAIFFFPQLQQTLNEFLRVLKPNGRIGISTFAKNKEFDWIEQLIRSYLPILPPQNCQKEKGIIFDIPDGLKTIFTEAGFENVRVIAEKKDFVYANEEEWWAQQWSHGMRELLEQLESDNLGLLKADIFQRFQKYKRKDGIHIPKCILFTFGTKPSY